LGLIDQNIVDIRVFIALNVFVVDWLVAEGSLFLNIHRFLMFSPLSRVTDSQVSLWKRVPMCRSHKARGTIFSQDYNLFAICAWMVGVLTHA